MNNIEAKVYEYIQTNNLCSKGESILAAVSGGADSMCMLIILIEYAQKNDLKIGVVHVNHGFREEAIKEAKYVSDFCDERNIPFFLKEIEKGACEQTEEAARIYRYKLIKQVKDEEGYSKIALAHNCDDRAETLLFNMFRGTGIKGLTSIRPRRDEFIRPILCLKRDEIEQFLKEREVSFCTDASNLEDVYSRNKIRHHILPIAKQINDRSVEHLYKLADSMMQIEDYISENALEAYAKCVIDKAYSLEKYSQDTDLLLRKCGGNSATEISFDLKAYQNEHKLIRTWMLRHALMNLSNHLKDITSEHIDSVDELAFKTDNAYVCLPYQIRAYKEYDKLILTNIYTEDSLDEIIIGDMDSIDHKCLLDGISIRLSDGRLIDFKLLSVDELDLKQDISEIIPRNKYTKWFDYDKINGIVSLRGKRDGDKLMIDEKGHHKSVNKWMMDAKIPERLRLQVPILAIESEVIWIVGYRDSFAYRITDATKNILQITLED